MNDSVSVNLIRTRGNRTVATIMTSLEEVLAEAKVSEATQIRLKRTIRDALNDFKDLAIDVVRSDASILNDEYVESLAEIKSMLREVRDGQVKR